VVISAGKDGLMDHRHAHDLAVAMRGDTELYEFSANGHMVNVERTEEFNAILKHHFLRSARSRTRTATAGRDLDNIDDGMGLLRGQLIDADCRRYKSVELRDDRWDNPLEMTLKMVMGWSLRFALFLPLMIALRYFNAVCVVAMRLSPVITGDASGQLRAVFQLHYGSYSSSLHCFPWILRRFW